MNGRDIVLGVADFAAGGVVGNEVSEACGDGIVGTLAGLAAGSAVGIATNYGLKKLDDETGIISDLGSVVDDIFSIF